MMTELRIQVVLAGCGEVEKKTFIGALQQGVQPGDPIFETTLEHCIASMSEADRKEMEDTLAMKEKQERNALLEDVARKLTAVVEGEIKEEIYPEELLEKEESFVRQLAMAAEGPGKENAAAALKKFRATGIDGATKALKDSLLGERYAEIGSALGVQITVQDETGLAINQIRSEMTIFLQQMAAIKKQLLMADGRLQKAFSSLDGIPGEIRESHASAYDAAMEMAQTAQSEFEAVCGVALAAGESVAAREAVEMLQFHDAQQEATKAQGAEGETEEATEEGTDEAAATGRDFMAEKMARKVAEMPDVDPDIDLEAMRAKARAGAAGATDEEKKARGLLYDKSKASAVHDSSSDEEDEGACDFDGGDPFGGV